jgi:heptosyltransferase-1
MQQLPVLSIEGLQKGVDGSLSPYIACFHSTARAAKRWPNERWVELGKELSCSGYTLVFPWGHETEMNISTLIACQIPGAIVPKAFSINEIYSLVAHASLTIGVDTGLTHLSAAFGKPTIEIYCDSPRWKTEGYWSARIVNLGDYRAIPQTNTVLEAVKMLTMNRH